MRLSFAYYSIFTPSSHKKGVNKLALYREKVLQTVSNFDETRPEYSLAYIAHPEVKDTISYFKREFKAVKHVLLSGIGGSSLGVEPIHNVLE